MRGILEIPDIRVANLATRRVLPGREAEEWWRRELGGRAVLEVGASAARLAEWAEGLLAGAVGRRACAEWAGHRLEMPADLLLQVDAPLRETLAARLRLKGGGLPETEICLRALGWRAEGAGTGDWLCLPRLLASKDLPVVLVAWPALRLGDLAAEAGFLVALRVELADWRAFLAGDAWDRASARWRAAEVFAPTLGLSASSRAFIERCAPEAVARTEGAADTEEGARSAAEALLHAVLEARELTGGAFRLNQALPFKFGTRAAEGDLTAESARLVVEVDGYYHFRDPESYRRDRRKDALLQEHGWFILRFLAEDVVQDMEKVVLTIERVFKARSAPSVISHS
jgi:very-short-patch-repair endonuclease